MSEIGQGSNDLIGVRQDGAALHLLDSPALAVGVRKGSGI